MATPGELVRTMATALSLPEPTLVVHDRNLAGAGLRSKSGRGPSAALVTPLDAAHLLVAVLASAQVKDFVSSVQRYQETRPDRTVSSAKLYAGVGLEDLAALPPEHSFIDALAALIASGANGALARQLRASAIRLKDKSVPTWPLIEVAALTPGTLADLRIAGIGQGKIKEATSCHVRYRLPDPVEAAGKPPKAAALKTWENKIRALRVETDLQQFRRVSDQTIRQLAALFTPQTET